MRGPTMIRAVAPSNRSGWGGSVKKMLLGLVAGIFTLPALGLGSAKMDEGPESFKLPDQSLNQIDRRVLKDIDRASLLAQDGDRTRSPQRPGPLGFAVSEEVEFNLESSGTWQDLPAGRAWRLVIHAPEAVSLNLGIVRFDMPEGAKLCADCATELQAPDGPLGWEMCAACEGVWVGEVPLYARLAALQFDTTSD